jgi:hypothetical protein
MPRQFVLMPIFLMPACFLLSMTTGAAVCQPVGRISQRRNPPSRYAGIGGLRGADPADGLLSITKNSFEIPFPANMPTPYRRRVSVCSGRSWGHNALGS